MENKSTDSETCEYLNSKDALKSADYYIENNNLYELECILEAVAVLSKCGKKQLHVYASGDKTFLGKRFKDLGYTVNWDTTLMKLNWWE